MITKGHINAASLILFNRPSNSR